jgi:hypothetical protein
VSEEEDEIEKVKQAADREEKDILPERSLGNILSQTENFIRNWILNKKALPVYLILAVLYVSSFRRENFLFHNGMLNREILFGKFSSIIALVNSSFALGSPIKAFTTVLIVLTLWSIYHYWIKESSLKEVSGSVLRKILLAFVAVVVLQRHVKAGTPISEMSERIVFIIIVYLELAITWFTSKSIDSIDLSSDLKNWTLRLTSLPILLLGALISISARPVFYRTFETGIYGVNVFLGGLLLMVLSGFIIYRSTRREPALKIW